MVQAQGGGGGGGNYPSKKPSISAPAIKKYVAPKRPVVKATPRRQTPRQQYVAPRRSSSSRNSGRSFRPTNGVGSSNTGTIAAKPAPTPAPLTPEQFLAQDSTYLQQKAALDKARTDYLAQQGQSKTQYDTNYLGDMDTLTKNRTQSLGDLENDYASRGLLQSGLYADSMSDVNTDYDKRGSALEQAKAAFLAQLGNDLTNFSSEQDLTLTKAKQEAAARRGAQYGV